MQEHKKGDFMCLVCIELKSEKLTLQEAKKNLGEMAQFPKSEEEKKHYLAKLEEINEQERVNNFWNNYYEGAD